MTFCFKKNGYELWHLKTFADGDDSWTVLKEDEEIAYIFYNCRLQRYYVSIDPIHEDSFEFDSLNAAFDFRCKRDRRELLLEWKNITI